jgi:hypothetical protein
LIIAYCLFLIANTLSPLAYRLFLIDQIDQTDQMTR